MRNQLFVFAALAAVWLSLPFVSYGAQTTSESLPKVKAPLEFQVDFSQPIGSVKALNGTNLWSRMYSESFQDFHNHVKNAKFSTVRLHDCPLDNCGMRLVDVHQIFGNLAADPGNSANYYFTTTDDYIRKIIVDGGSKVIYRLGASIEHSHNHYFTGPPENAEHYAEICAGIIRHYNCGWANGFKWNIQYWEIWCEPDCIPQLWKSKDFKTYCDFYVTVAKRLRKEFPNIKIGGPALTGANMKLLDMMADACRAAGVPWDFCSWHGYARTPNDLLLPPAKVRKLLDSKGFDKTELHLNEWHYFPAPWLEIHGQKGGPTRRNYWRNSPEGINGIDAAAFAGYVLTRWQDTPLDMANYYATGLNTWGLIGLDGDIRKPYYTFLAFAEVLERSVKRVKTDDIQNISLLGTIGEHGEKTLLVSSWKASAESLVITIRGANSNGTVLVKRIDKDCNLKEETCEYTQGKLTLSNPTGSFVLLIEWR